VDEVAILSIRLEEKLGLDRLATDPRKFYKTHDLAHMYRTQEDDTDDVRSPAT
jgi:hypothetical protein